MPFDISKAAAYISRVVINFNDEELAIKYNAGEKFLNYQRVTMRKESEMRELIASAERAEKGEADEETTERLQRSLRRARRDLCDNICLVIESWDLEAPKEYDRTKIREHYLASLSKQELRDELTEEDMALLESEDGPGPIPIEGVWLNALPLPDQFVLSVVESIGADFAKGASGPKPR